MTRVAKSETLEAAVQAEPQAQPQPEPQSQSQAQPQAQPKAALRTEPKISTLTMANAGDYISKPKSENVSKSLDKSSQALSKRHVNADDSISKCQDTTKRESKHQDDVEDVSKYPDNDVIADTKNISASKLEDNHSQPRSNYPEKVNNNSISKCRDNVSKSESTSYNIVADVIDSKKPFKYDVIDSKKPAKDDVTVSKCQDNDFITVSKRQVEECQESDAVSKLEDNENTAVSKLEVVAVSKSEVVADSKRHTRNSSGISGRYNLRGVQPNSFKKQVNIFLCSNI